MATLAVTSSAGFDLHVAALALPLLLLSYVAYKEASDRVQEAHAHLLDIEQRYHATVEVLALAVDAKDRVTHGHIRRVQRHTQAVCQTLGVTDRTEIQAIEAGALLHDIGKLVVPDHILNKPGALTDTEYAVIKSHAHAGATMLAAVAFPYPVVPIVRHHHERWDGRGYPDGLSGEAIPFAARVLAVVDCFDALTSDRPYRARLSDTRALEILSRDAGRAFDPRIVDAFAEVLPQLRRLDAASDLYEIPTDVPSELGSDPQIAFDDPADDLTVAPWRGVLKAVVSDGIAALADTEACVFRVAPDNRLTMAYVTAALSTVVSRQRLGVGWGLSAWVARHRTAIRNSEATLDLGPLVATGPWGAATSLPLFANGDLVGVLTVYRTKAVKFTDHEHHHIGVWAQTLSSLLVGVNGRPLEVTHQHDNTVGTGTAVVAGYGPERANGSFPSPRFVPHTTPVETLMRDVGVT